MEQIDFLIIGSGIAGLTFALKAAKKHPNAKVCIVTKAEASESNTKYAQGGIAVVLKNSIDNPEDHIKDTLRAGDGLCDEKIVRIVVGEGADRVQEIIAWGAQFDKNNIGEYDLGREGGHGVNRVMHHKDATGFELERTLLNQVDLTSNISLLDHHYAIDLITEHHLPEFKDLPETIHCYGAYVLNLETNKVDTIQSKITLVATGGAGQVYETTTNPTVATGDGIGMAYRAKTRIENMEFIQFHPTALYNPGESPAFLISEAVRGFGAFLRNHAGIRFMAAYDDRMELASRDIVARAIDFEMKKSGNTHVWLDCTHLDAEDFANHFPNIFEKCISLGINIKSDFIPVVPAAHYLCGGIKTDQYGKTNLQNLFSVGECTCTGLHGANRLASNSLLEALVFAHRAFQYTSSIIDQISLPDDIPDWDITGVTENKERVLIAHNKRELQHLMSDFVGIVRSKERLLKAKKRLQLLYFETKELYNRNVLSKSLCELMNLLSVAHLIVEQSLERNENRGAYYNRDLS